MKILFLSDSLGNPQKGQSKNEEYFLEDTYPIIVNQYFKTNFYIYNYASLDSNDILFQVRKFLKYIKPDIVIINFGINDCAPRLFKKNTNSFIFNDLFKKITFNVFFRFISKYRRFFIKYIYKNSKCYVLPKEFGRNINQIKNEFLSQNINTKFIALSIVKKTNKFEFRSPGINNNISKYNSIFKRVYMNYVDLEKEIKFDKDNDLISDSIHYTKEFHLKLASYLINIIKGMVEI